MVPTTFDCVLLAAGKSTRTHQWKMMLPCGDGTVIEASARAALEACGRLIVVAGHRAGELAALFRGRERVEVVVNARYEEGMLSSIRCGCERVRTPRFFLALGDMPLVDPATYLRLAAGPVVDAVIPKYRGKKGHPLLLSSEVARAVVAGSLPAGLIGATLRDVLAPFANLLLPVEDPHVLHDIDTDEDYRSLLAGAPGGGEHS
jgi:molybdenum cofactor cytidylyltransferase